MGIRIVEKQKNSYISLFINDLCFTVYKMTFVNRKNERKAFIIEIDDISLPNMLSNIQVVNHCLNLRLHFDNVSFMLDDYNKLLLYFDSYREEYF